MAARFSLVYKKKNPFRPKPYELKRMGHGAKITSRTDFSRNNPK